MTYCSCRQRKGPAKDCAFVIIITVFRECRTICRRRRVFRWIDTPRTPPSTYPVSFSTLPTIPSTLKKTNQNFNTFGPFSTKHETFCYLCSVRRVAFRFVFWRNVFGREVGFLLRLSSRFGVYSPVIPPRTPGASATSTCQLDGTTRMIRFHRYSGFCSKAKRFAATETRPNLRILDCMNACLIQTGLT